MGPVKRQKVADSDEGKDKLASTRIEQDSYTPSHSAISKAHLPSKQRPGESEREINNIIENNIISTQSGITLSQATFPRGYSDPERIPTEGNKEENVSLKMLTPVIRTLSHTSISRGYLDIEQGLCAKLMCLSYGETVKFVYNPVDYARELHEDFVVKFCRRQKKVLLLGMNPGPWGMGQTGVPFGHVGYARDWLGVQGEVQRPAQEHPKRPVLGLACPRNEVSGERMWSLLKELSGTPEVLFTHVFIHNYCPVFFLKDSAKNVTPPELKAKERCVLEAECDAALVAVLQLLAVEHVIGVSKYATDKTNAALRKAGLEGIKVSTLMHPSPVNPAANKGWRDIAIRQLTESGVIQYFHP